MPFPSLSPPSPALPFADRAEAGRALGAALVGRVDGHALILGLPRGGVPVAAQVAVALAARLDVFVVRKLGAPGQPELAMGAVASGGVRVLNPAVLHDLRISPDALERTVALERAELERRELAYRGDRPELHLAGHTVVLVDDGLATGASMRAAVVAVRAGGASRIVAAVPVGAPDSCELLAKDADEVVCLHAPAHFAAVGAFYRDFRQTSDDEVRALLRS